MDRKKFILSSAMSAFALTTFGSVIQGINGEFTGDCNTTNDILGPFYRQGAPISSDLTYNGLLGNRIILKGNVFKSDCKTPIKDALVEIWQCNTEGVYDNDTKEFKATDEAYNSLHACCYYRDDVVKDDHKKG